ncbi:DUF222 domain-containing protein [Pengzhenrongella phosphoraccumulans]|uniref:HNH endonuclease signature motif containing protein n=1 Tax=Pengzhenrongella phosphoraccumulans TaxID=3114394 RepID=UPI003890C867
MGTIAALRAPEIEAPGASEGAKPPRAHVTGTPPSDLSTPDLEEALTTLAGHINAATCRFLVLLGEFDAREAWAVEGILSCAHWLAWRCSLSTGAAREHVRVARALRGLPRIQAAFTAGRLSFSKVRALTRLATPDREHELVDLALVTPAGPLERFLRGLSGSLDSDDESRRHANRKVTWRWDDDGSLVLTARLSPEDGAVVVEALETTCDRLRAEEAGARPLEELPDPELGPFQDPQDVPAGTSNRRSLADALVTICAEAGETSSDTPDQVPNPTRRPELVVHVALADLTDPATTPEQAAPTGSGPRIEGGPGLLRETARRLACDARIVISVDGPTGATLDVGRAQRFPNAALTRALWQRDGGCRYPGCARRRHLHAHHLIHWADGGLTKLLNLLLLCGTHHRGAHEGRYQVERGPDGEIRFTSPTGATITPVPPLAGTAEGAVAAHDADVEPWTATPDWFGDRLDLSHAVEATRSTWAERERTADTTAIKGRRPPSTRPPFPWEVTLAS